MTTDSFHGHQEHPQPYSIMNLLPSSGATTIVQLPLAFVRSGYIILHDGQLWPLGQRIYAWSRSAFSSSHAYILGIYPTYIGPSDNWSRYGGFSLR